MDILDLNTLGWNVEAVLRLGAAAGLGALIGIERQIHGRSAGFRTQLLVALGSALAMVVSLNFAKEFGGSNPDTSALRIDPARVAYGVMAGIGFLGAGVIMRQETGVRGLTTAASLWCTAAMGLACGFGMYMIAAMVTGMVIFALLVLNRLDEHIPSRSPRVITVVLPMSEVDNVIRLSRILRDLGARISATDYSCNHTEKVETISIRVSISSHVREKDLRTICKEIPELTKLSIR